MKREFNAALKAARLASNLIMDIYISGNFATDIKFDSTPVTSADRLSNDKIISILKREFPKDAIVSEERDIVNDRFSSARVWLVDPLDGTKEFIKKSGEFSVNIALIIEKRPVFGLIMSPVSGEVYYGILGEGAFCLSDNKSRKIKVSNRLNDLRVLRTHSKMSNSVLKYLDDSRVSMVEKKGSALKACIIAKGEYDIVYSDSKTMEWDTAASDIIIHEAGGIMTDLSGELLSYNKIDLRNLNGYIILNDIRNKLVSGD